MLYGTGIAVGEGVAELKVIYGENFKGAPFNHLRQRKRVFRIAEATVAHTCLLCVSIFFLLSEGLTKSRILPFVGSSSNDAHRTVLLITLSNLSGTGLTAFLEKYSIMSRQMNCLTVSCLSLQFILSKNFPRAEKKSVQRAKNII